MSTDTVAKQAIQNGEFAMAVFEGDDNSRVREAILRDLLHAEDTATFPIQLTQHPYRPGVSIDLQRRFDTEVWNSLPKENLHRLAGDHC
jgi:hypothetical protein